MPMTHSPRNIVNSDTPEPSIPSWSDGSPSKGIRLDAAAQRLCKAIASHIKSSKKVDEIQAVRAVLNPAHEFNEQTPRAHRTLKGLWRRLEPLVTLKHSSIDGRCVDLTCGGIPHVVECVSCHTTEIAFCNNGNHSGQFIVNPNDPEGVVLGLCRACLPNKKALLKATSHKVAERKAEGIRAFHKRKALSAQADTEVHFNTPAHEKRKMKFDQRAQGHQRQQGYAK
jgi:hypothetical protein